MPNPTAERFVRALAAKDVDALKALFQANVDFRAMTPNKFWEAAANDTIVDDILFGHWFEPQDRITDVVELETSRVGTRDRVGYRLAVSSPDGEYLVEQQAYFETIDDQISWMRIICAGYLPVE